MYLILPLRHPREVDAIHVPLGFKVGDARRAPFQRRRILWLWHDAIRRRKPPNRGVIRPAGVPVQPDTGILDLAGKLAVGLQACPASGSRLAGT